MRLLHAFMHAHRMLRCMRLLLAIVQLLGTPQGHLKGKHGSTHLEHKLCSQIIWQAARCAARCAACGCGRWRIACSAACCCAACWCIAAAALRRQRCRGQGKEIPQRRLLQQRLDFICRALACQQLRQACVVLPCTRRRRGRGARPLPMLLLRRRRALLLLLPVPLLGSNS